ncbi:hypothetical protein MBLNU13_g05231t3 [Cladosporium sp. NU13]
MLEQQRSRMDSGEDVISAFPIVTAAGSTKKAPEGEIKSKKTLRDIDGNLAQHYFRRAIDGLPNLRHLMYGDFGALAYEGEIYAELCGRSFGKTFCPNCSLTDHGVLNRFNYFVFYLQICGRDWESLSIGRHPFETSYDDRSAGPVNASSSFQDDVTMNWDVLTHASRAKDDTKLQIKALRLPVMHPTLNVTKTLGGLSIFVGRGLVYLDLGVTTFWRFLTRPVAMWDTFDTVAPLLNPLLSGFDSLQFLTLRGVTFEAEEKQKSLLGLAATVGTLRLVDCYCPDSYDAFLAMVKDSIAAALVLTTCTSGTPCALPMLEPSVTRPENTGRCER